VVVITGAITRAKFQSDCHHQHTITQILLQARCPSCRLTNSVTVRALKGESITLHGLAHSGSSILVLTTKGCWLPWGGLPSLSSALWCKYPTDNFDV